ncbi:TonB-dependent receptor [Limibacter armeniacum]|uniref:SusC/RagA family TonB-linked outer membrane protein n=1 Tax=Limibacter armeniacum TaxID=466084 RepID=UPI002FE602B0
MKMRSLLLSLLCTLMMPLALFAQDRAVSGTITDENNEPLPGVTIVVKGTTRGTTTNLDGQYTLSVNADQEVMVISYIGYLPKEVVVGALTTFDWQMQLDAEQLEEIVVIGYGTAKKEDVTGSIATVDASSFNKGALSSPQDLLNGRVAGVQITNSGGAPGAGSTIRIRGGSSLSASNDPLIIIDGVPVDNGGVAGMRNPLNTINPNDIETFTVLKDASATAIYGSRAANGVIIITTKKGSQGGLSVDYTGSVSVNTPSGYVDVLKADEYRKLMETYHPEVVGLMGDANTDWQKEIFRTSISTDHNVAVGGVAGEWLPFRASVGYNNSQGILENTSMERTTMALSLTPKFLDDHLKVNTNVKGVFIKNNFGEEGAIGNAITMDPTQPIYDADGNYFAWYNGDGETNLNAPQNPVAMINQKTNTADVTRIIANTELDYKFHFLPEMSAKLNVGIDHSSSNGEVYVPLDVVWLNSQGVNNTYEETKSNELLDFTLNYNKETGLHRINGMLGYSWQHFKGDKVENYSDVPGTDNPAITYTQISKWENYLVSFFGRGQYTYDNRYTLTATLRADGSSRFADDNRWGIFPSVAASWNVINEDFLANSSTVSDLKLRVGYGVTGQQDIGSNYGYIPTYTLSNNSANYGYYDENGTFVPVTTLRPEGYEVNLKWEETATYNAGIDYGFFDNKLTGSLDVYHKNTKDLLSIIDPPAGTNLENKIYQNIGSMTNTGVELSMNAKLIQTSKMNWSLGFNLTMNKNEITQLTSNNDPDYIGIATGGISGGTGNTVQIHSTGEAINTFYVYQQIYGEDGKPIEGAFVDRNEDGIINDLDRYHAGNPAPTATIGLNTNFMYGNWDFSAAGRVRLGNYVYNNVNSDRAFTNKLNTSGEYSGNLTSDIYNTGFTQPQYLSDYYVQNASFFRLDNVMVGYNFPNKIFSNSCTMRVYATANNLFVITPYEGLDPEVSGGIDNNIYPRPRTFLVGVNIGF